MVRDMKNLVMTQRSVMFLAAAVAWFGDTVPVSAQYLRVRDLCHVKGQESNTLIGHGVVVGLKGTGDTDPATLRAVAQMLENLGSPVGSQTPKGGSALEELKSMKNVAQVLVTVNVPATGARQGTQLRCTVSATSAKSLEGGYLIPTALRGPNPADRAIYGFAQGPIALNDLGSPNVAIVHDGCRLEADFSGAFSLENKVTLVINQHHAGFPTAYEIQEALNGLGGRRRTDPNGNRSIDRSGLQNIATARDAVNVEVNIPVEYREHVVDFIATILDTQVALQDNEARVVVNERNGVIIVGDNVMVGRVAVTHKNVIIQTGEDSTPGPLFVVDQNENTSTTRLKALVDALNALKVDSKSIIDIIKSLERSGDIYGEVIVE